LARRNFLIEIECGCAVFIRVAEDTQPVKASEPYKVAELLEICFGFAGKSDDKRGTQRKAGNGGAHFLNRAQENLGVRTSLHSLQDRRGGVLQGDIDVRANLLVACDGLKQLRRDLVRIGIKKAYPLEVIDLCQPLEQGRKTILQPKIFAIASGVLPDQRDLAHTPMREVPALGDNRCKMAGAKFAAKLRNNAERTWVITALRNFDIRRSSPRSKQPWSLLVVKIVRQVCDRTVPVFSGIAAARLTSVSLRTRVILNCALSP